MRPLRDMAGHLEADLRSVGSASWPLASGSTLNFDPFVRHLGEDPMALGWREVTCTLGNALGPDSLSVSIITRAQAVWLRALLWENLQWLTLTLKRWHQ